MKTKKIFLPVLISVVMPSLVSAYTVFEEVDEEVVVMDNNQPTKNHKKKMHDKSMKKNTMMQNNMKKNTMYDEKMCSKNSDDYFESNIANKDRIKNSKMRLANSKMSWARDYAEFKNMLDDKFGFTYAIDATIMPQRAAPHGKQTAWQSLYTGVADMKLFDSRDWGKASVSAGYTMARYWGNSAETLDDRIGVAMPINDYPFYQNIFDSLMVNYQFGGMMNWLSLSLGQFQIGDFDGSAYDNNQQINFINYGFSQNGSSVYPLASMGGYLTISPVERFAITVGAQDAKNLSGNHLEWDNFGDKKYSSFVNVAYNPVVNGLQGQYSFLAYYQPSIDALPYNTKGWSFNMMQHYTPKMAIMARVNGIDSEANIIKQSYMFGHVINNPFGINKNDQFGLAYGLNKTNKDFHTERKYENVIEAFYNMGISDCLLLTPDVQFYINPAEGKSDTATAYSLRLTAMF